MQERQIQLAGKCLRIQVWYHENLSLFDGFEYDSAEQGLDGSPPTVRIEEEDWEYYTKLGRSRCAENERTFLTAHCSAALLRYNCAILHGVALRWRDRSYLICAGSGIGKSTQARFLQELRPGEFGIICGDRPVLEFQEKEIYVHPSPWNGKENWHGADAAPLSGVILLERGEKNRLALLSEPADMLPLYTYFIQTAATEESVRRVAALTTGVLKSVPVWKLTSFQVPDSTKLLLEAVFPQ